MEVIYLVSRFPRRQCLESDGVKENGIHMRWQIRCKLEAKATLQRERRIQAVPACHCHPWWRPNIGSGLSIDGPFYTCAALLSAQTHMLPKQQHRHGPDN
jgi:hypothetical protein